MASRYYWRIIGWECVKIWQVSQGVSHIVIRHAKTKITVACGRNVLGEISLVPPRKLCKQCRAVAESGRLEMTMRVKREGK